jgi:hypothetical protein
LQDIIEILENGLAFKKQRQYDLFLSAGEMDRDDFEKCPLLECDAIWLL